MNEPQQKLPQWKFFELHVIVIVDNGRNWVHICQTDKGETPAITAESFDAGPNEIQEISSGDYNYVSWTDSQNRFCSYHRKTFEGAIGNKND